MKGLKKDFKLPLQRSRSLRIRRGAQLARKLSRVLIYSVAREQNALFITYVSDVGWSLEVLTGESSPEFLHIVRVGHGGVGEEEGTLLDEAWIDIERVKSWMKFCDTTHAGVCHSIQDTWLQIDYPPKLLLIDVERMCLVHKPGSCQYLALSYVWGKIDNPFQTILQNFSDLCQTGAFDLPRYRSRLPETICDSIRLTKIIGQKYLWVDRFCIIQDDLTHKEAQLKSMASIYANAYFTIIASDGSDDSFGLCGIGEGSAPRSYHLSDFNFGPRCRMICRKPWGRQEKKYDTRGWTFQEKVLSRRQLIFGDNMVSWRCQESKWGENMIKPKPIATEGKGYDNEYLFSQWPNLSQYATLVGQYNGRQLSYPGDGLEAFSAITTVISRSMVGRFLFS